MHFVAGNKQLVELSLPENSQLRLSQRMRLEQSQLEQVSKRMMVSEAFTRLIEILDFCFGTYSVGSQVVTMQKLKIRAVPWAESS